MSRMTRPQLEQFLRDSIQFSISEEARLSHVEAITLAIASAPAVAPTDHIATLRRRITGLTIATLTLAQAGVAVAAQNSAPGDSLYPVKQFTEQLHRVFDTSDRQEAGFISTYEDPSDIAQLLDELATDGTTDAASQQFVFSDPIELPAADEPEPAPSPPKAETPAPADTEPAAEPTDGNVTPDDTHNRTWQNWTNDSPTRHKTHHRTDSTYDRRGDSGQDYHRWGA
jgi:hypothetical protein